MFKKGATIDGIASTLLYRLKEEEMMKKKNERRKITKDEARKTVEQEILNDYLAHVKAM